MIWPLVPTAWVILCLWAYVQVGSPDDAGGFSFFAIIPTTTMMLLTRILP